MNEEESKETYYANNRIKALRIRAGLDQQSLAEYCGTSNTTISNIENGMAEPRISVVKILANVLGVSIEYLMVWSSSYSDVSCLKEDLDDFFEHVIRVNATITIENFGGKQNEDQD